MHSIIKTLGIALLLSVAACQSVPTTFESVNAETFEQNINQDNMQLVDVRTAEEYAAGHIANSKNIDVSDARFNKICKSQLNPKYPVAVYCRSGRRSKVAAEKLTKMGFTVVELDGGFNEWKESKRAVEL